MYSLKASWICVCAVWEYRADAYGGNYRVCPSQSGVSDVKEKLSQRAAHGVICRHNTFGMFEVGKARQAKVSLHTPCNQLHTYLAIIWGLEHCTLND